MMRFTKPGYVLLSALLAAAVGGLGGVARAQEPAPGAAPAWVAGYRVRYTLRITEGAGTGARTVLASIPTGGWLKPDVSDVVVQAEDGTRLPLIVLAHDPLGDTVIQFRRYGETDTYRVYVLNPDAPPKDVALEQKIAASKTAAQQAVLAKMAALKATAQRAAELRDTSAQLARERDTVTTSTAELAEWDKLLPQRVTAAQQAAAKVPPAQAEFQAADAADAAPSKLAAEKTAAARTLKRESAAARKAADQAAPLAAAAKQAAEEAAKPPQPEPEKPAEGAAPGAAVKDSPPAVDLAALQAKAATLEEVHRQAEQKATSAEALWQAADKEAQAARLAAAPSAAARRAAAGELAQATAASKAATDAVAEARQRIAAATALKTASEQKVAELTPKVAQLTVAAATASQAAEKATTDTVSLQQAYFDLAADADPRLLKEGLTVEFRQWQGDKLEDWQSVVAGLQASENVTDVAIIGELQQNMKPMRRSSLRNFAASYRGYIKIDQPGIYGFCVNADDAAFLFINGYKVYSRTGSNQPLRGRAPIYSIGADIQLDAGVHPFEVHHVVGNTAAATGYCKLLWLPPGATSWTIVPRESLTQAHVAVPVDVEAFDGAQVAVFEFGMDDELSADGTTLYLARFEAVGRVTAPGGLTWEFGDGTRGTGSSVPHAYFRRGNVEVSLKSHAKLPPFRRRCHVDTPPVPTNPHGLTAAVQALGSLDLAALNVEALHDMFHFLLICREPSRWAPLEKLCRHLLARDDLDLQYRAVAFASLMESMAAQGHGAEALKEIDHALSAVGGIPTLRAWILLRSADIQRDILRNMADADRLYRQVMEENRRLRHPVTRVAAIGWGDMFMEAGDLARAADAYRLARTLGDLGAVGATQDDPVKRGALLRVAEQQLKGGDIRQSRRILRRIGAEYPEQKLEGLYRFLAGEVARHAGDYDRAVRSYEVLLHLRQWSSYRAKAVFGIADSYYRMGDLPQALEWFANLKTSFPDFYAQQQSEQREKIILSRQEQFAGGSAEPFRALSEEFEGRTEASADAEPPVPVRYSMGFSGPGTFAFFPASGRTPIPKVTLANLLSQGTLWIEFWYREHMGFAGMGGRRLFIVQVLDDEGTLVANTTLYPERTYGHWQKAAFRLDAPATSGGTLLVYGENHDGMLEIDALKVLHVSDRQDHALRSFIEGADPQ